ncbi:MAG: transposase [Proteobacteria bacterium]|nr:transposase [Pseudomonadota bacterium]
MHPLLETRARLRKQPFLLCVAPHNRYLGRYTHRVAISNQRIQSIDERGVRFATKGGRSVTLPHQVFIARFLEHILPAGFTKMRHFGLYASGNVNTKLEQARALLNPATASPSAADAAPASAVKPLPWNEIVLTLTGIDPMLCPRCGVRLVRVRMPRPISPHLRPPQPRDTS